MSRPWLSLLVVLILGLRSTADEVVLNPGAHAEPYPTVAVTPDGGQVLTLGRERSIRVWDANTGKPAREIWLPEKSRWNTGMRFGGRIWLSPDGRLAAIPCIVGGRGRVALVPLAGPESGTYRLLDGGMSEAGAEAAAAVAFSPDGRRIAIASPTAIRVLDIQTNTTISSAEFDTGLKVTGLAFSPDGKTLAAALPKLLAKSRGPLLVTWAVDTGKLLREVPLPDEGYPTLRWSPDGRTMTLDCGRIRILGTDGKQKQVIGDLNDHPDAVVFDPSGRLLSAWRKDGRFVVRDELTDKEVSRIESQGIGVAFSADGRRLVTRDECVLAVHDVASGKTVSQFTVCHPRVTEVGWAGDRVLTWGAGRNKEVRSAIDLVKLETVPFDRRAVSRVRNEWGGVRLTHDDTGATATFNGKARRLDYRVDFEFEEIETTTLVGPDAALLVSRSGAAAYDTRTGRRVSSYPGQIRQAAPSPDGRFFVATDLYDPLLRVYRPDRNKPVLTIYAAGNDWIAWTTSGEWTSSPGGAAWAGRRAAVDPGKLPAFEPFPAARRSPEAVRASLK